MPDTGIGRKKLRACRARGGGAVLNAPDAETAETVVAPPRTPWEGKPRRIDIACWAAITLSGLYYWVILPFRASLVGTHPMVLELLNGSTEAIIAGAAFARVGHGSIVAVLAAAIPGIMKFDIIYWWAGRLWGERIILLLSGRKKRGTVYMDRVRRWGRKFLWPAMIVVPFVPIPSAIVYVIAGWSGMGWITFLLLDAIGTLAWAGTLAGLGWEMGHHAVVVAQTISHYGLWVTIGIVVLIVGFQVRSARAGAVSRVRAATAAPDPAEPSDPGASG